MVEFSEAVLDVCGWLGVFFENFYSFSFETILETFDCESTLFLSDPARISFAVSLSFSLDSFLIPTQSDIEILLSTAFSEPSIGFLLAILAEGGGAFATTTAISYDVAIDVQTVAIMTSTPRSSGSPFVAWGMFIVIAGAVAVRSRRRHKEKYQTQQHSLPSEEDEDPITPLEGEYRRSGTRDILGRTINRPTRGYMGFDEAIEIDFFTADNDEEICYQESRSPLFKQPFLLHPSFGDDRGLRSWRSDES
jgi:hypothetical protein